MYEIFLIILVVAIPLLILFTGVPIAFALSGASALIIAILFGSDMLFMIIAAISNQVLVDVYLAIPMFVLMAFLFQHSGIAADLYISMYMWMGGIRGGLAAGTVGITTIIAALSGVGGTGTVTMGILALPELIKRKYCRKMSLGCIVAGGALGPIIPPSILMIIVGGYAQLSVGKMFIAGIFPGLIISASFITYIFLRALLNPKDGPAISIDERVSFKEKIISLKFLIFPLLLIVAILGVIYTGICTPTEAAGVGVLGTASIGFAQKKLKLKGIKESLVATTKVSSMVMWLIFGGACYSSLINISGIAGLFSSFLSTFPFGNSGLLMLMIFTALVLGMFIDPVAICMLMIPIFMPAIKFTDIDPLWAMMLFTIAVVIGYITPPFGMNLFIMRGVTSNDISMREIYAGTIPFAFIMMICLIVLFIFPQIILILPELTG